LGTIGSQQSTLRRRQMKRARARLDKGMGMFANNKGFTLIEMALVLIIIGIIIGAVVKGKDLVRGAEQKKVYTKYMSEWRLNYLNFYDRTGKILGDTWDGAAAGQDGQADTAAGAAGNPTDAGRDDLNDGPAAGSAYMGLAQLGLTAPQTNTANNWQYKYVDSGGNAHFLTIAFDWDGASNYNYMEIDNCPNELAMAFDTMIDGEADGSSGDFLHGTGAAWDTTPTTDTTNPIQWKMQF
jgi:prepilin-type N-terminal cleavage/methylation domain-containing protein